MSKKKQKKTKGKRIAIIILGLLLLGVALILIINSTYHYDPLGSAEMLADGEKGTLVLDYNGADNQPATETISYEKNETIPLPVVSKQGYHFSGWIMDPLYVGNEVTLAAKKATVKARFDKDYTAVTAPCAVYVNDLTFTEYQEGDYAVVATKAVDVFLDGGYKMTIYSKENFAGKQTKVYYSGMFHGFIGSMKIEPVHSERVEVPTLSNDVKATLLTTFAPRIWWHEDEPYFASSVEFAAANMEKSLSPYGYTYYIKELDSSHFFNDFLYGNQAGAKGYAFAVEKEFKYLDLAYYFYTPYNKGKEIAGIECGNHVGDWEHVTVRLMKETVGGKTAYRPVIMEYSAHFFKNYYAWDEIELVENTHPVGYCACGSHGMWKDNGEHVYVNAVVLKLKDECSQGTAWDMWQDGQLETYAYDALTHQGEGIGKTKWNSDFGLNVFDQNGGVTIWGNTGWFVPIRVYPRLDSAPEGPQHKKSLNDYYTMHDKINDY